MPEEACELCLGTRKVSTDLDSNQADICTTDHNRFHRETSREEWPWLFRGRLPSGEYVAVEAPSLDAVRQTLEGAKTDEAAIQGLMSQVWPEPDWADPEEPRYWRVARLWQNCGEEYEQASIEEMKEASVGAQIAHTGAWRMGRAAYRLQEMGDAWMLHGYNSLSEMARGLGFAPRTLRAYVAAERTLQRETPHLTDEQRDKLREIPIQLMITARQPVTQMTSEQVDDLINQADTAPVSDLIDMAKSHASANEAKKKGKRRSRVTVVAKAVTMEFEITHDEDKDPVEIAQNQFFMRSYVVGVSWAPQKQQTVEELA